MVGAVGDACPDYHTASCTGLECLGFDILVKDATPLPGSLDDRDVSFGAHHQHSQEHHHGSTPGIKQA